MLISLISLAYPLCLAADFIRGDVNGDGSVSIADAQVMLKHTFRSPGTVQCADTMDVDDGGGVNIVDGIYLLNWLIGGGPSPLPPFPDPGPDPQGSQNLGCDAYGGGTPLTDPAAKLRVLDAVVEGGSAGTALITVSYSSSAPLAGLSGVIADDSQVFFQPENPILKRPAGDGSFAEGDYRVARLSEGELRFGALITLMGIDGQSRPPAPAGEDLSAFTLEVCIRSGTPAGEYPLTLSAGELIDEATGRAIHPSLVSGRVTVLADVVEPDCSIAPPPPIPVDVTFSLRDATGSPGGEVEVPFFLEASLEPGAFNFCIDFDETVLRGGPAEQIWRRPSGKDYDFLRFAIDNEDSNSGSGGVDEGFVVGAAIVSTEEPLETLPRDQDVEVLHLRFTVLPSAPNTTSELRFLDRPSLPDGKPIGRVTNTVTVKVVDRWRSAGPEVANSFVFVNSRINIIPDGTPFVRGDSNDDGTTDVSDASFTLGHLFLGGTAPRCADAADANDDGGLDVTDPIATLSSLFLGGAPLPAPFPAPGEDPTGDRLSCPARS